MAVTIFKLTTSHSVFSTTRPTLAQLAQQKNMTITFDSTYYIILIIGFSNHIHPNKDFYESWSYSRKLVQAVIPYEWERVANAVWVYEKL